MASSSRLLNDLKPWMVLVTELGKYSSFGFSYLYFQGVSDFRNCPCCLFSLLQHPIPNHQFTPFPLKALYFQSLQSSKSKMILKSMRWEASFPPLSSPSSPWGISDNCCQILIYFLRPLIQITHKDRHSYIPFISHIKDCIPCSLFAIYFSHKQYFIEV